jgi:hypothetical protein
MSQNVPLFERLIRLRQEEAELLGFKNHAVRTSGVFHFASSHLTNPTVGIYSRYSNGEEY